MKKKVRIEITWEPEDLSKVSECATAKGMTVSALLAYIVQKHLKKISSKT